MASIISAVGFSVGSRDGELASLEAALRHHAELGSDAVEIAITSLDMFSGGRVIPDRLRRLAALTKAYPLRYTVHGLVCSNFMDPDTVRPQINAAKAILQACDAIGARIQVQHCGSVRHDQMLARAGAHAREAEALHEVLEAARSYDIRIALENIFTDQPGEHRRTPAELGAFVAEMNHPHLVALIDFSHAYIEAKSRGLDFRAQVRAMAPVTGHLHVHDSFGLHQGRTRFFFRGEETALGLGDIHMPLGWGDIEWEAIFSELTFLPGTVLMMEIGGHYGAEHPECLARARKLAELVNARA